MEVQEYQKNAGRTVADLGSVMLNNIHMTLGMVTEAAEIADVFKRELAYGKAPDMVNVQEELGDQLWYIANTCNINGWDMRDIMNMNIKKLEARYPGTFTTDAALNRNLENEREILENNSK